MTESPSPAVEVQIAMQTDVGQKRQQNQDAIGQSIPENPTVLAHLGRVFVLADGVGGLQGGDLASQYAVSTVLRAYFDPEYDEPDPAKRLARAIVEANTVIFEEGQAQTPPTTMATTIVAAVIRERDLIIGSVGDSPAYLLRGGEARQLTQDHNLEAMQRAAGVDLPADSPAGRKLVRALGHTPTVQVDIITGRVREGDTVVLCSDGLTRYIASEEIEATVAEYGIEDAVPALIETANVRGGADNISVIMLHIAEDADHLLHIRDPMESWGQPRRAGRGGSDRPRQPQSPKTTASKPVADSDIRALVDSLVQQALDFMRSNTVITGVGLAVLLVIFVIIMFLIAGAGGDSGEGGGDGGAPNPTHAPPVMAQTETAAAGLVYTQEADLAATQAQIVRMTQTPPTATYTPSPAPTAGPMLDNQTWFRVKDGDPIRTHTDTSIGAPEAEPLEPGDTYRVMRVNHDEANGPWYLVIDHLGEATRWVNGPSLHQRIVAVDEHNMPLPLQPVDVPPGGTPWVPPATRTPGDDVAGTLTPAPTGSGTPGTPPPTGTTVSPTPTIEYGVEAWGVDYTVRLKPALPEPIKLCSVPDVNACDVDQVDPGESGMIIEGPVPAGGHWWWKIEFNDGRSGWVAQVLLELE